MLGQRLNGEMVLLAREKRRMTQTELANASGLPQAAISRIESGDKADITPEQLSAIAAALRFPQKFFYLPELLYRNPISLHAAAFRKKASVPIKALRGVVAEGNHYVIQLRKLLDAVEVEPELELLQFEVVSEKNLAGQHARAVGSATEAAELVRASWQIGNGPLQALTPFVEATGVTVIHADFADADVDGFTLRPTGLRPVIMLNKNRSADRMRFSLAHEYGHVVLHPFPYDAMESEANEFAAALLMPKSGILPDLRAKRLNIPRLGQLKLKWRSAMSALVYRARELGTISPAEATRLWIEMKDYRVKEPAQFDVPREEPKLLPDLIRAHVEQLAYNVPELAIAVATFPDEFSSMHGLEAVVSPPRDAKPKLRLVASRD